MAPLLPTMYKSLQGETTLSATAFMRSAGIGATAAGGSRTHLPDNYGPLSSFGRQERGNLPNNPSFQFSRTDRLQATRPFYSDIHTDHSHAEHEVEGRSEYRRPGFGYYDVDAPYDKFGRSGLQADFAHSIGRENLPAPDHNPHKRVERFDASYSSLGRQLLKRTEARNSFKGVITRAQRTRVYLGPEFEKDNFGLITPGPQGVGNMNPGIGKQVDSVKVTAPRATFGSAARITSLDGVERHVQPWDDPDAPGPQQYHATQRFSRSVGGPKYGTTRGGGGGGGESMNSLFGGTGSSSKKPRPVLHSSRR